MTIYRGAGEVTYRFDFWYRKQRYFGSTEQRTQDEAKAFETNYKARLRRQAGGLLRPEDTPRIAQWAGVYYEQAKKQLEAPQHVDDTLRVILRFWGEKPSPTSPMKIDERAPYHDLRLADPIEHPKWITDFEAWVTARGVSNQTRNHYFSVMSRMYRMALLPQYREVSGITMNPFAGIPRLPTQSRDVTLTPQQIRAWIEAASYHVRLAVAIGGLASKLRERNILSLKWDAHFDPDPRTTKFNRKVAHYIRIARHKTARRTRRPLVTPVSAQLLRILKDAHRRNPTADHVITYRGTPVKDITAGVKAAVEAAGLQYGRDLRDEEGNAIGVTFHTLRHSATTLMSDQLADPLKLMDATGHTDITTTLKYRHARPRHQKPAVEGLSRVLKIEDLVMRPQLRATGRPKKATAAPLPEKEAG